MTVKKNRKNEETQFNERARQLNHYQVIASNINEIKP